MTPEDARYGNKLIKIMKEAGQEISQELVELAEQGKYAKKLAPRGRKGQVRACTTDSSIPAMLLLLLLLLLLILQAQFGRSNGQQNQRSYGYRGLGGDDYDDYKQKPWQKQNNRGYDGGRQGGYDGGRQGGGGRRQNYDDWD